MTLTENIAYHASKEKFSKAFSYALRYAIISLPWTVNRMHYSESKTGIEKRLRNIVLGKIPEYLVWDIFQQYNIRVEPWAGETEFWQKDRFDILVHLDGHTEEWDIKSLTIDFSKIAKEDWLELPALIPNRHGKDQWSKRNTLHQPSSHSKRYLFSFLENPVLKFDVSESQVNAFAEINQNNKYYINQAEIILKKVGRVKYTFEKTEPRLVITGVASEKQWHLFRPIPKGTIICDGLIKTRIQNMGVEIRQLPSFLNVIGKIKL